MARQEKYTIAEVIAAIRKAQTAQGAALILGCDSDTIRNYAKRHPKIDRVLYAEREDLADHAEAGLKRAVLAGEPWAIALTVKTLGKGRGYTERTEITGANGGALKTETVGRVHGGADHIAAVLETLVAVGAIELRPAGQGGDAEDDEVHTASADG